MIKGEELKLLVIDSTGSFGWKQMYCEGFGGGTNTNLKRDDVLRYLRVVKWS